MRARRNRLRIQRAANFTLNIEEVQSSAESKGSDAAVATVTAAELEELNQYLSSIPCTTPIVERLKSYVHGFAMTAGANYLMPQSTFMRNLFMGMPQMVGDMFGAAGGCFNVRMNRETAFTTISNAAKTVVHFSTALGVSALYRVCLEYAGHTPEEAFMDPRIFALTVGVQSVGASVVQEVTERVAGPTVARVVDPVVNGVARCFSAAGSYCCSFFRRRSVTQDQQPLAGSMHREISVGTEPLIATGGSSDAGTVTVSVAQAGQPAQHAQARSPR